jgi:hypothetical protein
MTNEDRAGEALADVERIHPLVDRLRRLLTSATLLDMKTSSGSYWADGRAEGDRDGRLRPA